MQRLPPMSKGLKVIALFKAVRGLIAFLLGVALIIGVHYGVMDSIGELPIFNETLSEDISVTKLLLWFDNTTNDQFLLIATGMLGYALLRWIEATGIWFNKTWAEYLAVLTGCIYLLMEAVEFVRKPSIAISLIFTVNLLVVIYLCWVLLVKRAKRLGRL
jgi:uncharacterized membrane protein (DUF2068 family)